MVQLGITYLSSHFLINNDQISVDNVASEAKTIKRGKYFYEKAKLILLEADFELTKWVTNDSELENFFDS